MGYTKRMWAQLRAHWKAATVLVTALAFVALFAVAQLSGIAAIERYKGFFAPVWDADGRHVYLLERDTRGVVWGLGWEFFTPPASSYVLTDRLTLRRLDSTSGASEILARIDGSPVTGRATKHYRGRIFNTMSARITPTGGGVDFAVRMQVPRVPSSEQWALTGSWSPDQPPAAQWLEQWAGNMAPPDEVLQNGIELMTVRGREAYPAAVLAVEADGRYRVLVKNDDFDRLYPDGVPPRQIAERASRGRIEHGREFRRVQAELTAKYRAQGLDEGAATLRAYDDMEELGLLPKSPRLVATTVSEAPADVRVFDIPPDYFRVGLFQDIATAIATPNEEVKTSTSTYLKYYDDDLGLQLKAWRNAGNDRFAVRTDGALYLLEVRRFER